jgi:hypothetical protein
MVVNYRWRIRFRHIPFPCDKGLALSWCQFFYGLPSKQELQEYNPIGIHIAFISQFTCKIIELESIN